MQPISISVRDPKDRFWRNCWLDTERALAASTDKNLSAVYTELLEHYQRMADRYELRQSDDRAIIRYEDANNVLARTTSHGRPS